MYMFSLEVFISHDTWFLDLRGLFVPYGVFLRGWESRKWSMPIQKNT